MAIQHHFPDAVRQPDGSLRGPPRRGLNAKLVLNWGEELETGIDAIDADHRDLISYFNALVDTLHVDSGQKSFRDLFAKMVRRTRRHFWREECIMRHLKYPYFQQHKEEHEKLLANAHDFDFNIEHIYRHKDLILVVHYLRYWLINHMRTEDKALRDFVDISCVERALRSCAEAAP